MAVRTSGYITFFIGTPVGNTCIQQSGSGQNCSACLGKDNNLLSFLETEQIFLGRPVRILVNVSTELFWLIKRWKLVNFRSALLYIKRQLLCFYSEQAYTLICLHSYRPLFRSIYNVFSLDSLTPMLKIFAEYNAWIYGLHKINSYMLG